MRIGFTAILAVGMSALLGGAERTPVLLELFTSEGCSSCPPAEALLEKIDKIQPLASVNAIVLSEHVDYWNDQGWVDPYSSHAFNTRQDEYGKIFHHEIYTPQLVVDGSTQLLGSDVNGVVAAMAKSAQTPKVPVTLTLQSGTGIEVAVDRLPEALGKGKAGVFLAIADDSATSKVLRGENANQTLHHVAIVHNIKQIGNVTRTAPFSKQISLNSAEKGDQRVIVFVQDSGSGRVFGAAMLHSR